jgi:regulator of sirC expression with transglutaminase-like and TPR domain
MLTNLKLIYLRKNDINRSIRILNRLRQIAPNDPSQIRDLGVVLLQAGQPSKALSNLESYIRKVPSALEDDEINNWIKQAKKEISNSN